MVRQLLDTIDSDNNGIISYQEWRDFFLFIPLNENGKLGLDGIVESYFATIDFNADYLLVSSKPNNTLKYLIAGGIAGAISRTATAPLDRLKVFGINRFCYRMKLGLIVHIVNLCPSKKGCSRFTILVGYLPFLKAICSMY